MDYKAKIRFTTNEKHPDVGACKEIATFEDVYHLRDDVYENDDMVDEYICEDLMLVAGGGYDADGLDETEIQIICENTGHVVRYDTSIEDRRKRKAKVRDYADEYLKAIA